MRWIDVLPFAIILAYLLLGLSGHDLNMKFIHSGWEPPQVTIGKSAQAISYWVTMRALRAARFGIS